METRVAEVTDRIAENEMLPEVAVIVVVPAETGVTFPLEPAVLLTVATDAANELQVTDDVIFCVLPSEKIPVAVNCSVVPRAMLGLVGVTSMDTSVAVGAELLLFPPIPLRTPQEYRKGEAIKKKIINRLIVFALLFLFDMPPP
jgi:hypothetical protein